MTSPGSATRPSAIVGRKALSGARATKGFVYKKDTGISGAAIAAILGGAILAWSGIRGRSISSTTRDLLSGKNPADDPNPVKVAHSTDTTPVAPTPATGVAARNQTIARALATPFGWSTGNEWDSLVKLWDKESSWNNTAEGAQTNLGRAYGIPQALPPTKLPLPGQKPISDPTSQIAWGLGYIKGRYGTPAVAWQHETDFGWY